MNEEYDYVELYVTNVRKIEADKTRCVISLQRANDVREFIFFTDEHNAAQIAVRAFPRKSHPTNVSLWSEFTVSALNAFDTKIRDVTIIRGHDEMFRSIVTMLNSDTGMEVNLSTNISNGVLLALSSNIPIKMERRLFEDVSGINNEENKIKVPLTLLPRKIIEQRLTKAVQAEDYELASLLRDELKRRDDTEQSLQYLQKL